MLSEKYHCASGLAALGGAVVLWLTCKYLRRMREKFMPRRDPCRLYEEFTITTPDGLSIAARRIDGGPRGAVIVAHPAVTGQRYAPLVDMVEMLAEHYDVFTFDFRGHGGSEGRLELNLAGPLDDMSGVVAAVRAVSYTHLTLPTN